VETLRSGPRAGDPNDRIRTVLGGQVLGVPRYLALPMNTVTGPSCVFTYVIRNGIRTKREPRI
jgi:hypothetical protein